ncbi:hypothetical protein Tco_0880601 [Tanacetum coccineum]
MKSSVHGIKILAWVSGRIRLLDLIRQINEAVKIGVDCSFSLTRVNSVNAELTRLQLKVLDRLLKGYRLILDIESGEKEANTEILDLGSGERCEKEVSTANELVSTAGIEVSTTSPEVQVYTRRSVEKRKDKGKAIMMEDEFV